MNKATILAFALMIAVSADHADAQDVYVVDAKGGSGSVATEIDAAVALAGPFDTILVRSGIYLPFTIDGLGLTVVADTDAIVRVNGGIVVRNVPAGQVVVLRGLSNTSPAGHGLFAHDNAGALRVENCAFRGASDWFPVQGHGADGLRAEDCAEIVVTRTWLTGGDGGGSVGGSGAGGGTGLRASGSSLAVYNSVLRGGNGAWADDIGGNPGHGVRLADSFTYLMGSQLTGGKSGGAEDDYDFGCECVVCGYIPPGGSGLLLDFGSRSAVSVDSTFTPGAGGVSTSSEPCPDGSPGQPVSPPTGAHTVLPGLARGLRAPAPVREGESMELVFIGQPGDQALMLYSPLSALLFLQQFTGVLLVPPASPLIAVGTVPVDGTLEFTLIMPLLPTTFDSATILLQSVYQPTSGGWVLGGGSNLIPLDQSF